MGNSTGSMFYLFAIVIVLWLLGAGAYTLIQWFKKRRTRDKSRKASVNDDGPTD